MKLVDFLDIYNWDLDEIVYICDPNIMEIIKLSSVIDLLMFTEYQALASRKVSFFEIINNQLFVHLKK